MGGGAVATGPARPGLVWPGRCWEVRPVLGLADADTCGGGGAGGKLVAGGFARAGELGGGRRGGGRGKEEGPRKQVP